MTYALLIATEEEREREREREEYSNQDFLKPFLVKN